MNILIFSWRGPGHPHAGGAELSTHEHAKVWVRAGHNVLLFTSYYPGAKKEEIIDGVMIKRQGSQILKVHLKAFLWYISKRDEEFDLVVDQFHGIPFFTPLYVRTKKLAFIHEVTKEVWGLNPWPTPLNLIPAIFGTVLEPLIFKLLYKHIPFMTVSASTKDDLTHWGIPKENITVVHNGLNIPHNTKIFSKEKIKTAIFLGALSKDKGIEDTLRIFSILNSFGDNWQFWIVGKGEAHYLLYLKLLAKRLNLDRKIKFLGYVPDNKKFELLSRAHILVNPSVREGWGLVVIEAASMGVPTIAYDVPGLRDSIIDSETGIICRPRSQDKMAEEILNLFKDRKRYQSMSKKALWWSKKFSWKKAGRASLKLINNVFREVA